MDRVRVPHAIGVRLTGNLRQVAPCDDSDPGREALQHKPTYGRPEEHPDQLQASVCALCEQHDAAMSQSQAVDTM